MNHDPYYVTPRRPLTPAQKLKMFLANDGICCLCGHKIDGVKQAWDEHVDPLWLNGTNDLANRKPAHEVCARGKTAAEAHDRAKDRSVSAKHFGAKKRPTMAGSRGSKWKKKMNGTVERRDA